MAGPKQFPKVIGDKVFNQDIIPDTVKSTGTTITFSDYGLPSSRIGTIIRATDTAMSKPFVDFLVSTSTVIPRFSAYAEIGAAGGGGAGGGGDYGANYNAPGGGGGGGSNYIFTTTVVTPGDPVTIVVGAGGPGNGWGAGSPGGSSVVNVTGYTFTAIGGGGGGSSRNAYGGAGANGANPGTPGIYRDPGRAGTSTNGGPSGSNGQGYGQQWVPGGTGKVKIRFYN